MTKISKDEHIGVIQHLDNPPASRPSTKILERLGALLAIVEPYMKNGVEGDWQEFIAAIQRMPAIVDEYAEARCKEVELKAKLSVAANAKIHTNKHGYSYIVFTAEDRDISQNELTAIFYDELSKLNKIDVTLKTNQSKGATCPKQ